MKIPFKLSAKTFLFLSAVSIVTLFSCEKSEDSKKPEKVKIDFVKASGALMDSIRPQLFGTWKLKEVSVTPFPPSTSETGIYKDTILKDFAVLDIHTINKVPAGYAPKAEATLQFRKKTYPVGFSMRAADTRLVNHTGPQMISLLDFLPLPGSEGTSRPTEPEERYLYDITLIGENYFIEIAPDGKTMTWKGMNRAIKQIIMVKQ